MYANMLAPTATPVSPKTPLKVLSSTGLHVVAGTRSATKTINKVKRAAKSPAITT